MVDEAFLARMKPTAYLINTGRGDLVETRVIDGVRYILIRAEEGVQVNGVEVQIGE